MFTFIDMFNYPQPIIQNKNLYIKKNNTIVKVNHVLGDARIKHKKYYPKENYEQLSKSFD